LRCATRLPQDKYVLLHNWHKKNRHSLEGKTWNARLFVASLCNFIQLTGSDFFYFILKSKILEIDYLNILKEPAYSGPAVCVATVYFHKVRKIGTIWMKQFLK